MHTLTHKLFSGCIKINQSTNKGVYKHPSLQPAFGSARNPGGCRACGRFSKVGRGRGRGRQRAGLPAPGLRCRQPPARPRVPAGWGRLGPRCHPPLQPRSEKKTPKVTGGKSLAGKERGIIES